MTGQSLTKMTLPDYFAKGNPKALTIDGTVIAEYMAHMTEERIEVFAATSYLIFVIAGEKVIESGDAVIKAKPGDFIFLRSGRYLVSSVVPPRESGYYAVVMFLDDALIRSFAADHPDVLGANRFSEDVRPWIHGKCTPLVRESVNSLIPYFTHSPSNASLILKHKLYEILLNLLSEDAEGLFKANLLSLVYGSGNDLKLYMEKNFFHPYTLEHFAKNTFRSLSRFKNDFREMYGTTPKKWINEKRLERALHLIENRDNSVTDVAFLSGFESVSHFIMLFREKYGETPKQLQNRNRQK
ncbi:MAG TPA: AraC family transcriptional regulator [Spirochaetota bacterium]|nr:AraC family transcriptional regulator [Spirochaetota bacterium]